MRYHGLWNIFFKDAICIDQNNDANKSSQVSIMGRIFGNAECVMACLGPGNELTRRDFDNLATKPYFSRLGIKQEFLLAKSLSLFCGLDHAYLQDLESLIHHYIANSLGGHVSAEEYGDPAQAVPVVFQHLQYVLLKMA